MANLTYLCGAARGFSHSADTTRPAFSISCQWDRSAMHQH